MDIKDSIRSLRIKSELTQEELAQKLGVSFSTINRWENSKSIPNKKHIQLINKYLNKIDNNSNIKIDNFNRKKPLAYSFFSGGCGMLLGIKKAGFEIMFATDINDY